MMEIWMVLVENFYQTTWLEAIAVLFGLASVWFAAKNNIWVFPTGIINVLIYIYICQKHGLYADMGINAFYFIMSVYGWYNWTHNKGEKVDLPITRASTAQNIIIGTLIVLFFIILRYVLIHFTDSQVPNIDSLTTSIFLVAMWLMAKKKIENWTLWIVGDLITIPLYFYKDLTLTSIQYLIFLAIAIKGYRSWNKQLISKHV